MYDLHAAKPMAKALRAALAERSIFVSHSDCLELVAQQFGLPGWNVLAAKLANMNDVMAIPDGWSVHGVGTGNYRLGAAKGEKGTATIRSEASGGNPDTREFATLMQSIDAVPFINKRLRLGAELKAKNISGAGTLWMRVDDAGGKTLAFDNMERRENNGALSGNTGWLKRDIVLDVPQKASSIHFGFFLRGTGQVWCRNLTLDEADPDAPATSTRPPILGGSTNLDFGGMAH